MEAGKERRSEGGGQNSANVVCLRSEDYSGGVGDQKRVRVADHASKHLADVSK
jgi:hypothetical protein